MQINCVLNAVTAVLDWDMPNESYSEAVTCHLADLDREEGWEGWDSWGYDPRNWGYGIDTPAH